MNLKWTFLATKMHSDPEDHTINKACFHDEKKEESQKIEIQTQQRLLYSEDSQIVINALRVIRKLTSIRITKYNLKKFQIHLLTSSSILDSFQFFHNF
jgi:hypothetical protein